MEFEGAAVYAGEEILSQPGDENRQRAKAGHEKRNQESTPVMEAKFE
jgi:hypothetical protein